MQNESKGIIILDIDGTVVDVALTHTPSQKVIDAVRRVQEKYLVSLATGRPGQLTLPVADKLKLKSPMIVLGGTEIVDPGGTIIWSTDLSAEAVASIAEVFTDYNNKPFLIDDYDFEEYKSGGSYSLKDLQDGRTARLIEVTDLSREEADSLEQQLDAINGVKAVKSGSLREGLIDLHIMSSFATKEHAIAELLKITQIDVDRTIGVGDGHNDLHLFNAVKTKIAMGNAVPELKEVADRVIGDVKEDGLADFLMELANEATS